MAGRRACRRGRGGRTGGGYSARVAQRRAKQRAVRRRPAKLIPESALRALALAMLRDRLSPQADRWRASPGASRAAAQWQVSHETIYRALYLQGRGNLRAELTDQVVRSGQTRRRTRAERAGAVRSTRPWTTGLHISTRPAEAADRAVPGHREGDLLLGARGCSAIITCVERSTRFVLLGALPNGRTSEAVIPVLSALIARLPEQLRRSLAWDNGPEMPTPGSACSPAAQCSSRPAQPLATRQQRERQRAAAPIFPAVRDRLSGDPPTRPRRRRRAAEPPTPTNPRLPHPR